MTTNNTSNTTDPSHGDPAGSPPAHGATSASHGEQSNPALEELQRQLAAEQAKNAEILKDNAKYRTDRKKQEEAAQSAEQARLKESGEYKTLAETHAARVAELEPISERYATLSLQVASQIDTQIKDWPAEVKTFDPGKDAPIEQRLAWLEKSKPLIAKLADQQRATNPGNRPNPTPNGGTPETTRDKFLQQMRRSGKYGV